MTASGRRAFSLLELIVVLVVLGLLAGVAAATFGRTVGHSEDRAAAATLEAVARDAAALAAVENRAVTAADFAVAVDELAAAPGAAAAGVVAAGGDWQVVTAADGRSTDPSTIHVFEGTGADDGRVGAALMSESGRCAMVAVSGTRVEPSQVVDDDGSGCSGATALALEPPPPGDGGDGGDGGGDLPADPDPVVTTTNLTFSAVGDTNGLFHHLGTRGGTQAWVNPSTTGAVVVSSSGLGQGTHQQLTDRAANDLYLANAPGGWWQVELPAGAALQLDKVTFRNRTSGNGKHACSWQIQGSNDGATWADISAHSDECVTTSGTWRTYDDTSGTPFRWFRVTQTAPDSGGTDYFTMGELELYGTLTESTWPAREGTTALRFTNAGDTNGVFYAAGTRWGAQAWPTGGPVTAGLVEADPTNLYDTYTADALVDRTLTPFIAGGTTDSITLDLGPGVELWPSDYTLQNRAGGGHDPRSWRLEGSLNGSTWTTLREHVNDQSLTAGSQTVRWSLDRTQGPFRFLRLANAGTNGSNGTLLLVGELEVYGDLRVTAPASGPAGSTTFTFTTFDSTGLFHHAGTNWGAEAWRNPVSRGIVSAVTAPAYSHHPSLTTDRAVSNFHPGQDPNATVTYDFGQGTAFEPTGYALRSRGTYSDNQLRNWALEGSNDGASWVTLREHSGSLAFKSMNQWRFFHVENAAPYRMFRMRLTGTDGSGQHYLTYGEIELFGHLARTPVPGPGVVLAASAFGDEGGLFWHLGTAGGSQAWVNPVTAGEVGSTWSSVSTGTPASLSNRVQDNAHTTNEVGAWMAWDLGARSLRPTFYTIQLRGGSNSGDHLPRNWELQGSNDGSTWTTLRSHVNDLMLRPAGWMGWYVDTPVSYRHLRLLQTGPTSSNTNYLVVAEVEFYGVLSG